MGPKDCLYQHPEDCSKYVRCEVNADGVTGRPVEMDCPQSLEWNDKLDVNECVNPEQSTCPR